MKSCFGFVKRNFFCIDFSTGLYPVSANSDCACAVYRNFTNAFASVACFVVDVTATGFSIRIVAFGATQLTDWPLFFARIASFSYWSATSPLPARNVCRASRALDG